MILAVLLVVALVCSVGVDKLYWDAVFAFTERSETEKAVKAYADEMGISYGEYPESMIDLLERNPETEEFVLQYPFYEKADYTLEEYGDPSAVPLFLQWDSRWGYEKYGSDVMGITGCGPTCLAMAGYYLTGDEAFTPEKVASFAELNGYYASGYGSSWTLISEGGIRLGLDVKELPLVESRINETLKKGNPVILAMGKGDFTTTGHYIVLTGIREGMYTVNDPNSVANSQTLWSYDRIEGQIRNLWAVSLPEQAGPASNSGLNVVG